MIIIKDSSEIIGAIQAKADVLIVRDKRGDYRIEKSRFGGTGLRFTNLESIGKLIDTWVTTQWVTTQSQHDESNASELLNTVTESDIEILKKILTI